MPIYDYHCPQCEAKFEQLVSYSKADEVSCPHCGRPYAIRQVSRIAARVSGENGTLSSDASSCASSGGG
jgi:putative FmdB family regulatory protein